MGKQRRNSSFFSLPSLRLSVCLPPQTGLRQLLVATGRTLNLAGQRANQQVVAAAEKQIFTTRLSLETSMLFQDELRPLGATVVHVLFVRSEIVSPVLDVCV